MQSRREFLEQGLGVAAFGLARKSPEVAKPIPTFREAVERITQNENFRRAYLPKITRAVLHEDVEHAWVIPLQPDGKILYGEEVRGGEAVVGNVSSMLQGAIPSSVDVGLFMHTHPASGTLRRLPSGQTRLQQLRAGQQMGRNAVYDPPSINWGPWTTAGDLTVLAAAEAEKDAEYRLVFGVSDSVQTYYVGVDTRERDTFAAGIGESQRQANAITRMLSKNQMLFRHFTEWSKQKRQGFYQNLMEYSTSPNGAVAYRGVGREQFIQLLDDFIQYRLGLFRKHAKALQRAKTETDNIYGQNAEQVQSLRRFGSAVEDLGFHFEHYALR